MSDTTTQAIDVKHAIQVAKRHVAELFADDDIINVALEEVRHHEDTGVWSITIGFSFPWDRTAPSKMPALQTLQAMYGNPLARTYKRVQVAADGKVLEVSNRPV